MKQLKERILTGKRPFVVALDGDWASNRIWLERLKGEAWGFKVGSVLFSEVGPKAIEEILKSGFDVFLDLKFHDIPNTVEHALRRAFSWGVKLATVHSSGGVKMCEAAAAEQKPEKGQIVLAVSILTSLDDEDLKRIGFERPVTDQVLRLAEVSVASGIGGLVSSAKEVSLLRKKFPETFLLTPGIRIDENKGDQKRTETPSAALASGSDLLVIGRALTEAPDWKSTWQKIISS